MFNRFAPLGSASLLALALAAPSFAQEAAPAAEEPVVEGAEAPADEAAVRPDLEEQPAEGAPAAEALPAAEAPAATPEGAAEAPTRDSVVASVNGVDITLGEVVIAAAQLPPQYQQLPPEVLFGGVVEQLVQQELLSQSLTAEPGRVALALANQRRSLRAGEVVTEVTGAAVTDEALQAAYDAQFAGAEPQTEWNASHILVATEEEARAVVERLNGGEDFAAVAQEVSTDTGSGAQGGELGWFGPGMMVPEFETAVAGLEAGATSEPVESQFGFHVIRLNETRPLEPPALDAVRGELENQLRQQAIQARIAELQGAAEVTLPAPGRFDPALLADPSILQD